MSQSIRIARAEFVGALVIADSHAGFDTSDGFATAVSGAAMR